MFVFYFFLDLSESINESMAGEKKAVTSRKLLERKSRKKNGFKKSNNVSFETSTTMETDRVKRIKKTFNNDDDPLRLFLRSPETKKLLTIAEEKDLFAQIQAYLRRMSSNNYTSF